MTNFLSIIEKVGAGIIANTVPGGSAILSAVNDLLPADKKLPLTATGKDAKSVLSTLTPEQKASVLGKQFDVELKSYDTIQAMITADATDPHSTRPYIARGAFFVLSFAVILTVSIWAYGVLEHDVALVSTVMKGWPFVLSVVAPFITLLLGYFGILKGEHKNKLNAISNI